MDVIEISINHVSAFLSQAASVQIYAYPNFLLEFFLSVLTCMVYVYLNFEVTKIYKQTVNLRPHTIHFRRSVKGNYSKESLSTSVTHIQHEYCKFNLYSGNKPNYTIPKSIKRSTSNNSHLEWLLGQQPGDFFKPIFDEHANKFLVDKLAALTPAQFVKLDKERQMRERQIKGCMNSLTTLFDNIVAKKFSETRLKEQIESAKEETACSGVSDQVIKYIDSESVTESLINVLNDIVEDASAEHPIPVTLVYDIGNLKERSSMIFDTKCELVQSSTSGSTVTKTDITDRHD